MFQHVYRATQTDPLTGLASREAMSRFLADAFELPGGGAVGLVRCDVDRFDWINDALGLSGGDAALQQIAELLSTSYPPPALVGRLGGDEFMVVLPTVQDAREVTTSVQDLEDRLRTPLTVGGHEVFVALSIGTAVFCRAGLGTSSETAAERIIREAGMAMRREKNRRRAEWPGASGADLLELDGDLHRAIDRGEIVAYFQPQYDAREGTLTGFEALARWHHPEHGALSPDRFIPLAEADGLIHRLGETVLEQACRFADLVITDQPLQMAVNVSTQQLSVPGLADQVQRVLNGYPNRAWTLTVEITESALMRNQDLVLHELERLGELGVGVSIDDFGSGYSSLSQLRDLPVTELKIDRSFVQRDDAIGRGLLGAIITLAGVLDLTVVAEGIEMRSQLEMLRDLGSDRLQGMYLSPPLPPKDAPTAPEDIFALL